MPRRPRHLRRAACVRWRRRPRCSTWCPDAARADRDPRWATLRSPLPIPREGRARAWTAGRDRRRRTHRRRRARVRIRPPSRKPARLRWTALRADRFDLRCPLSEVWLRFSFPGFGSFTTQRTTQSRSYHVYRSRRSRRGYCTPRGPPRHSRASSIPRRSQEGRRPVQRNRPRSPRPRPRCAHAH